MNKKFRTKTFYKLYSIVFVVILSIAITFIFFIYPENLFLNILFVCLSLFTFFAIGIGIWNILLIQKNKNILLSILNYFLLGCITLLTWGVLNKIYLIIINIFFEVSIFPNFKILPHLFLGSLLYIIDVLFFHLLLLFEKYNEKSISEEKLKSKLIETRLNALKAYINPHFLFNSLNSVNALIKNDTDRAREMLVNIANYFRYTIKQKDNNFVTLLEEYNNALLYLEIEKLRFVNRIEIEENIDKDTKDILIPTMILQPILENIVKHAVAPSNEIIYIVFSTKQQLNNLIISISNNYNNKLISNTRNGLGLATIIERLYLIYETEDILKITKTDTQFNITITIPIIKS